MSLDVKNLSFEYNGCRVLDDIGFSVPKASITAVLGPNGVGKTTLLKCLNNILSPKTGQVTLDGQDIGCLAMSQIARLIAYVPQINRAGQMTVFDAVLMGRTPHIRIKASADDINKTQSVMAHLNLCSMGLKSLDRLSGGELQKVAIARVLVQEADLMLMDEPTASLDMKNQADILRMVRDVARSHDMAVVMTMHDLNSALRYADAYICLKDGKIEGTGKIDKITPDLVSRVYGVAVEIVRHRGFPMVVPLAA